MSETGLQNPGNFKVEEATASQRPGDVETKFDLLIFSGHNFSLPLAH